MHINHKDQWAGLTHADYEELGPHIPTTRFRVRPMHASHEKQWARLTHADHKDPG